MYLPIDKRKARKDIKDIGTVRNTVTRVVVEIYTLCVLYKLQYNFLREN